MKKHIALLLLLLLALSLCACGHEHTWKAATCTEPKTCAECGAVEGEPLGHSWKKATCTEPKTCTRCGAVEGAALGHSWKDATCTEPKTCTVCGAVEGAALGHSWKEATYDRPKTCTVCGATEGEPLARWASGTVPKPGAAVDKNGFCVDSGTFLSMMDELVKNSKSDFYCGYVTVKKEDGFRSYTVSGCESYFFMSTGNQSSDGLPKDKDEITLTIFTCLLASLDDTEAITNIASAMLYLTHPDLTDFDSASAFLLKLMNDDGNWTQKDAMEYSITGDEGIIMLGARMSALY